MTWVLIIWTCIQTGDTCAHLKKVEIPMPAESVCHEMMRTYDDRWNGKNPTFHYKMKCEPRHSDTE